MGSFSLLGFVTSTAMQDSSNEIKTLKQLYSTFYRLAMNQTKRDSFFDYQGNRLPFL